MKYHHWKSEEKNFLKYFSLFSLSQILSLNSSSDSTVFITIQFLISRVNIHDYIKKNINKIILKNILLVRVIKWRNQDMIESL